VTGTPATNSTDTTIAASTMAEPRSLPRSSSAQPNARNSNGGTIVRFGSRSWSARRASRSAVYTSNVSFNSSDGWNDSGPKRNHARAPLISDPTPGTSTAIDNENEPRSMTGSNLRNRW
jgi:hypothetical protein